MIQVSCGRQTNQQYRLWKYNRSPVTRNLIPSQMPYQAENGALLRYTDKNNPVLPTETKIVSSSLWVMNYFTPCNPFPMDEILKVSHLSITISTERVQMNSITLFSQFQHSRLRSAIIEKRNVFPGWVERKIFQGNLWPLSISDITSCCPRDKILLKNFNTNSIYITLMVDVRMVNRQKKINLTSSVVQKEFFRLNMFLKES